MAIDSILQKAVSGGRISGEEALELLRSNDLTALGAAAHQVRMRMHPERVVTYIIERNINYSNICAADCDFCGFYAKPWDKERGVCAAHGRRSTARWRRPSRSAGHQILLQGGLHPKFKLEWYEEMLRHLKERHGIHLHAFSPPEIFWFAKINRMDLREVLRRPARRRTRQPARRRRRDPGGPRAHGASRRTSA